MSEIGHLGPEEVGKFYQFVLFMWGSRWRPMGAKRESTLEAEIGEFITARW